MGVFANKTRSLSKPCRQIAPKLVLALALLAALSFPATAGADGPTDMPANAPANLPADPVPSARASAPPPIRVAEAEAPVSTSPLETRGTRPVSERDATARDADDRPLTRAAAARRVANMSPVGWLSSYGPVSVDRTR